MRKRAKGLPIVWIVDDEQANRDWFVENHRLHFALIIFSSRAHLVMAFQKGVPCDVVVTDVFFPASPPKTSEEEQKLLSIYENIERKTIAELPGLWPEVRSSWQLQGFEIAADVVGWADRRKEIIPVVLYSRKAPLLLTDAEWLKDPKTVRNTYWITEKIDPGQKGDVNRQIASIQRTRINALLSIKQKYAPWWMKVLSLFRVKLGPFEFRVEDR